jgi:hypothetical protein
MDTVDVLIKGIPMPILNMFRGFPAGITKNLSSWWRSTGNRTGLSSLHSVRRIGALCLPKHNSITT